MLAQVQLKFGVLVLIAGAMIGATLTYAAQKIGFAKVAHAEESQCLPATASEKSDVIFVGCGGFF